MSFGFYNQMAVDMLRVQKQPEYQRLIETVGTVEAERLIRNEIYANYSRGISIVYPSLVVASVLAGVGALVGAGALTSSAVATVPTAVATASKGAWVGSGYVAAVAAPSATKTLLLNVLGGLLMGTGYVLGSRITWDSYDAAKNSTETKAKEDWNYQISQLGRSSDEYLKQLGFDDEEIAVIRAAYADYLNELAETKKFDGSVPDDDVDAVSAESNDMPEWIFEWNKLYNQFVNQGVSHEQAILNANNVMGADMPPDMLPVISDVSAPTDTTFSGVLQEGDVYSWLQQEINLANVSGQETDPELLDDLSANAYLKSQKSNRYSSASAGAYSRSSSYPSTMNGEFNNEGYKFGDENDMSVRKGRNGQWVWANSGKPVNGGRTSGFTRSFGYRRRY